MAHVPLLGSMIPLHDFVNLTDDFHKSDQMPVLFIGHGHPMNALFDNAFTESLSKIATQIPKPTAIMMISAHWETSGTYVGVNPQPHTIHDFGNFDPRLFQIRYEPSGHPELARQVIETAKPFQIHEAPTMGLDHGAWTVLKHIYPQADVPVFQMSIDYTRPPAYHFELARAISQLRRRGVLVIGSGNIVHNLRRLNWHNIDAAPQDWAVEFDVLVKKLLDERQFEALVDYQQHGALAQLAVPTNDHYLPMIYTLGLADRKDSLRYLFEGYQYGSISMRCFLFE